MQQYEKKLIVLTSINGALKGGGVKGIQIDKMKKTHLYCVLKYLHIFINIKQIDMQLI